MAFTAEWQSAGPWQVAFVDSQVPLRQWPLELQGCLTEEDRDVLRLGPAAWLGLAMQAQRWWLGALLRECAESDWSLEFWRQESLPPRLYFRGLDSGLAISLPHEPPPESIAGITLPSVLAEFYSLLGGLWMSPFPPLAGLLPVAALTPFAAAPGEYLPGDPQVEAADLVPFFVDEHGRWLGFAHDEGAAWLTPPDGVARLASVEEQLTLAIGERFEDW